MNSHFAGGESAGFIKGDSIHAGESFDRIEVLDEDLLAAEPNGGESENRAS